MGLGGANELSASARHGRCRALPADQKVLDFNQLINHSTFIWRSFKIHTQRRSTFFLLQGFLSSMFTKSLNPSSVLFQIRNSKKYGNGVPMAKISVGTPFPVVPIGNEPWLKSDVEKRLSPIA